jgi:hypothetical protein
MKKVLILLLIFSACKKEVYYYPSKDFFDEYNPQEIIIDDLSFQEITDSLSNGLFRKEKYFLTLVDKNKEYRISPFTYTGGFIKEKNVLEIVDDSICVYGNKVSLHQLNKRLKLHYENNGREYSLPDSYNRAFIKLVLKPNDNRLKLEKLLLKVIRTFNGTNIIDKDSIDLGIMFDYPLDLDFSKIPPPSPPVPLEIND